MGTKQTTRQQSRNSVLHYFLHLHVQQSCNTSMHLPFLKCAKFCNRPTNHSVPTVPLSLNDHWLLLHVLITVNWYTFNASPLQCQWVFTNIMSSVASVKIILAQDRRGKKSGRSLWIFNRTVWSKTLMISTTRHWNRLVYVLSMSDAV